MLRTFQAENVKKNNIYFWFSLSRKIRRSYKKKGVYASILQISIKNYTMRMYACMHTRDDSQRRFLAQLSVNF